ncbi:hypothetical protein P879_05410 [Paragonimus westermani]|uniref:DUF4139 domain-containing protein n=1 Tax=Paragonimus westermani TaxID=34504 RepID=A0A8T0DKB4_9TREM|nr:hypothetical protein P879_05410 [Paragonimus westermani]
MRNFFALYNSQTQQLDEDAVAVGEELEHCRADIEEFEEKLSHLSVCQDQCSSKELHVLLDSRTSTSPCLELSYSVSRATWSPTFDIRLSSAAATLQINYYGIVVQSTGEDWELGKLTLSTAQLTRTGELPELLQEKLSFRDHSGTPSSTRLRGGVDRVRRALKTRSLHTEDQLEQLEVIDEITSHIPDAVYHNRLAPSSFEMDTNRMLESSCQKDWQTIMAERPGCARWRKSNKCVGLNAENEFISELEKMRNQALAENHHSDPRGLFSLSDDPVITGLTSPGGTLSQNRNKHLYSMTTLTNTLKAPITDDELLRRLGRENADRFPSLTFEVSKTTPLIRGNGDPQRVVLTVLEFRPTLEYVTIPKLLPKAFLRARMHNTSEFALLEGLANVYIDNSFNGKTKVSATAIQEELILDLGIDPGVQVTYKPRHKYKKTGSFIGGKNISITFTQIICLTNTYSRSVRILVVDQLPVSTDDRLKVQLIEPAIRHPDKYDSSKPVRLNKNKMVEWDILLGPSENRELVLKYLVEHPILKEFNVTMASS